MPGSVYDTYVAARRQITADVPEDAVAIGVVRRHTAWFYAQVEENRPVLGPPSALLDEVRDRKRPLEARGIDDAHDEAVAAVDFDERHLAHVDCSEAAQDALLTIVDRLSRGEDVALVCHGNTDERRCHRTLLRERVERRTGRRTDD